MQTVAVSKRSAAEQSTIQSIQSGETAMFDQPRPRSGSLRKIAQEEWAPALVILVCDVVFWVAIYGVLSFARHDQFFSSSFEYAIIDMIQLAVIVQALFVVGGYNPRTETRSLSYTAEHILAMLAALAVSSLVLYAAATFDQAMKPSRGALLLSFLVFTPISILYRRQLRERIAAAAANRAFLVIGAGELATNFYNVYHASDTEQRLEFVDPEEKRVGQPIAGEMSPVIEGNLLAKLRSASTRYSGIILAERLERIGPKLLDSLVRAQFQQMRVYTLESFHEVHWRHVPVHSIDPFWPLQTGFQLSRNSPYHYLKRLFDVLAALVGLIVFAPIMLIVALLIAIANGRPVIFKQPRVGRDEQLFTIYKFRTMGVTKGAAQLSVNSYRLSGKRGARGAQLSDNEEQITDNAAAPAAEDIYTRENDPRISAIGRSLRKLRLDELPQLWNVLRGDISLIGPRAEWIECARRYQNNIPLYHFRHLVKPGITGWAQVNYPYGESDKDAIEKLKYDLYYIRHYSLKLDAMIVLKTIHTMLFGKGR